jgi:hypothetical protein
MQRLLIFDIVNIFNQKIFILNTNTDSLCKQIDRNICFQEKHQFSRRKLAKIVENSANNIDPSNEITFRPPSITFICILTAANRSKSLHTFMYVHMHECMYLHMYVCL